MRTIGGIVGVGGGVPPGGGGRLRENLLTSHLTVQALRRGRQDGRTADAWQPARSRSIRNNGETLGGSALGAEAGPAQLPQCPGEAEAIGVDAVTNRGVVHQGADGHWGQEQAVDLLDDLAGWRLGSCPGCAHW